MRTDAGEQLCAKGESDGYVFSESTIKALKVSRKSLKQIMKQLSIAYNNIVEHIS